MDRHSEYYVIIHPASFYSRTYRATFFESLAHNVGETFINILILFSIGNSKQFIRLCPIIQVRLNGLFE